MRRNPGKEPQTPDYAASGYIRATGILLRRTGFLIPSETFCATAGLWSVDITFGSDYKVQRQVRRAEPWTGSAECYGSVVSIRRITSLYPPYTPPDGIFNPVRNVLCNGRTLVCGHNVRVGLQRSVGRNHGRVPPNAMDRSPAFGGSHPCIRPTTHNSAGRDL